MQDAIETAPVDATVPPEVQKEITELGPRFVKLHAIGEYHIVEMTWHDGRNRFQPYVNGQRSSTVTDTLDSALLLGIGIKHMDINEAWRFETFATRMLKPAANPAR